jgi:hypothetical protein
VWDGLSSLSDRLERRSHTLEAKDTRKVNRTVFDIATRCMARMIVAVALVVVSGCGVLAASKSQFANQAETGDGRKLFVEDIEEIVFDDLLDLDQQRQALRNLGIEDEDLIDALLTLSEAAPAAEETEG